jgi:hypothetical protein
MSATAAERVYELLPALYRIRDLGQGQPLRALLQVVQAELDRVDDDIARLYDNWFIETCEEWVVPYIGDLLRVRPLHPVEAARVTTRAYVANTLAYRRRKGTAVVLEQLARDTTGWPAKAGEFFTRLITAQHMNHIRLAPAAAPEIRDAEAAELTSTPFDRFGHTLEVRRIASRRGRYNIPNVGIFLWRIQSYPIGRSDDAGVPTDFGTAREIDDGQSPSRVYYTFNPVGLDSPLFNDPQVEETITHAAEEENVPGPLRRLALHEELEALRRAAATLPPGQEPVPPPRFMTAANPAFRVLIQSTPGAPRVEIPREQIYMCEIPDEVELASPAIDAVAIDPDRGRVALARGADAHRVFVTYSYGFPGDLGGGPYDRTGSIDALFEQADWQRGVSHIEPAVPGLVVPSLRDAVDAWNLLPAGRTGVIALMDSVTDGDPGNPPLLNIRVPATSNLLIVAAGWPAPRVPGRFEPADVRPHVIGDLIVHGEPGTGARGRLAINGLLLEGSVIVAEGHLGELRIAHTTIVPRHGELLIEGENDDLRLDMSRSITGPVTLLPAIASVAITDCLVAAADDGSPAIAIDAPGNEVAIERTTVWGSVLARVIDASNSIFMAPLTAERRQKGCIRFSFVPPGSRTARRHRCQPETAVSALLAAAREAAETAGTTVSPGEEAALTDSVRRRVVPAFESERYGDPDFGQLTPQCADEIRRGSDTGCSMGGWCFLQEPHREANLAAALDEYLRFGLQAGVFFVPLSRRKERR